MPKLEMTSHKTKNIIINVYKKENYESLVSIGWKKLPINNERVKGDYIVLPEGLLPELIKKLDNIIKK